MSIPEVLNNFKIYYGQEATDLIGVVDVTLPDIESLKTTLKGGGIAGELDVPLTGQFGPMNMTINSRVINKKMSVFFKPGQHTVVLMGSIQVIDKQTGLRGNQSIRVDAIGSSLKNGLGKFEIGAGTDSSVELGLSRIKVKIDGEDYLTIDKLNFVFEVSGEDMLADIRTNLGI